MASGSLDLPRPSWETKHLPLLKYLVDGLGVVFELSQDDLTGSTGSSLWLSSQILTCWLLHTLPRDPASFRALGERRRALDLGAGIGLLSLVLGRMGWDVVATDIEPVLSGVLRTNVDANTHLVIEGGGTVSRKVLDWTRQDDLTGIGRFDIIVTSDTIYHPHLVGPLCRTIASLLQPCSEETSTLILLALERRDDAQISSAFRVAREQYNLDLKMIPARKLRKVVDSMGFGHWKREDWEGVEVWEVRMKRNPCA